MSEWREKALPSTSSNIAHKVEALVIVIVITCANWRWLNWLRVLLGLTILNVELDTTDGTSIIIAEPGVYAASMKDVFALGQLTRLLDTLTLILAYGANVIRCEGLLHWQTLNEASRASSTLVLWHFLSKRYIKYIHLSENIG